MNIPKVGDNVVCAHATETGYVTDEFSIFAEVIAIDEDKGMVTIKRAQKFGTLPIADATISINDFERYYLRADAQNATGRIKS